MKTETQNKLLSAICRGVRSQKSEVGSQKSEVGSE
jgi:hypothetical protein